jgi:MSHA biogenesis protein MshG
MTVMMPKFIEIFNGFNIELPLPTRMLIGMSRIFTNIVLVADGLTVIAAVILFKRFQSSAAGGGSWTSGG